MSVTKGSRAVADRADVTILLAAYRTAKDAEAAAKESAEAARAGLIELAGDSEALVDPNGLLLCKLPERTRRTMPVDASLAAHPDLIDLVNISTYRVVTR